MINYRPYLFYSLVSLLLLCLGYYALFCLQFNSPIHAEYWVHDEVVLKQAMANRIHTPKVIVIAGSNGLYGINSKILAEHIGMPAINLSVYGGLPLDWLFYEINKVAHRGDIVILPLEWEYYTVGFAAHASSLIKQVIAWDKDYFNSLSLPQQLRFITAEHYTEMINVLLRQWHKKKILRKHPEKIIYSTNDLLKIYYSKPRPSTFALNFFNTDTQGDILNTCKPTGKKITLLDTENYSLNLRPILKQFLFLQKEVRALNKKHILVFVTFPPMFKNSLVATKSSQENIATIVNLLFAYQIPVLGKPDDYLFRREDFYDTHYHLRCQARDRRTEKVVSQLQSALAKLLPLTSPLIR